MNNVDKKIDYWKKSGLKMINKKDEIILPIQKIVQLDMVNVAIMKKYIALSFKENECFAEVPSKMRYDRSNWNDVKYFQGYFSACFCFLNILDYFIRVDETKEKQTADILLQLIGTYNKNEYLKCTKTDTRDKNQKIFDEKVFNIDISEWVPLNVQTILKSFCPAAQSDNFYSSWQFFCSELYSMIAFSKEAKTIKYFKINRIKYVVMNLIDDLLEQFIQISCSVGEIFEWYFCYCTIKRDLNIANKTDIEMYEKISSYLTSEAIDDFKKESLYINGLENIKILLSTLKNKGLAENIARNLIIAEKYGV